MISMTLAEVAMAVDGRLDAASGEEIVTGTVEFDSREIGAGGLFVALAGERSDGHDFADAAHAAGAAGVLASRPVGVPAVLVADVLTALSRLAGHLVRRLPETTVLGLTGSSGKTTTKDLLAAVLSAHVPAGANVVAPPGSFNNELGHPWTVLRADADTRHLVLELAARGLGHIAAQCAVAPPRIGMVLNVGSAHVGEFGSAEAIAVAKGELVESLPSAADGGVAVLNADDPQVAAMSRRTAARVVTFGRGPGAHVRAEGVTLDGHGRASFQLVTSAGSAPVRLNVVGEHQVYNALAVAAATLEVGLGPDQVASALSGAGNASRWRMEVTDRPDGVTVINDAYNANPESMRAALNALSAIGGPTRRRWAVLGPMAELGSRSEAAHAEVGALAGELGVQQLVSVGTAGYQAGYGKDSMQVPDVAAALDLLRAQLRPDDVVLVKASRSAGLERVAAGLLEDPGPAPGHRDPAVGGDR
ncbi:MAG TPA: UDP-N-acetylmuramoyl-tripeptide--D-alanyl-D-alanine ligase [Pseudonocardia sp.]|nr:UDP-N-acetylmuramoyl-tripeptide--D-alanyl-D-alanine ligase [Pseudonocardia sp.]